MASQGMFTSSVHQYFKVNFEDLRHVLDCDDDLAVRSVMGLDSSACSVTSTALSVIIDTMLASSRNPDKPRGTDQQSSRPGRLEVRMGESNILKELKDLLETLIARDADPGALHIGIDRPIRRSTSIHLVPPFTAFGDSEPRS